MWLIHVNFFPTVRQTVLKVDFGDYAVAATRQDRRAQAMLVRMGVQCHYLGSPTCGAVPSRLPTEATFIRSGGNRIAVTPPALYRPTSHFLTRLAESDRLTNTIDRTVHYPMRGNTRKNAS
jgi:hypothetical protein